MLGEIGVGARSKSVGGMSFQDLEVFNFSLLAKQD